MKEHTDEELLALFKEGDNPAYAFNLIVRKYQERLYWLIRRTLQNHEDANDVLQNTFIKAWKALPKFRADAKLYSWLYRIAVNESLNLIKSNKRNSADSLDDHQLENTGSGQDLDGNEIQLKLEQAIATLPEKQRMVFHLKYFEDKKYSEISELLGTSVGGLKASYHHAVKKIEHFLTSN